MNWRRQGTLVLLARQSLPEWSNRRGSQLSIVETDVYVWRYTLLVVLATKERVEVNRLIDSADWQISGLSSSDRQTDRQTNRQTWTLPNASVVVVGSSLHGQHSVTSLLSASDTPLPSNNLPNTTISLQDTDGKASTVRSSSYWTWQMPTTFK